MSGSVLGARDRPDRPPVTDSFAERTDPLGRRPLDPRSKLPSVCAEFNSMVSWLSDCSSYHRVPDVGGVKLSVEPELP